MSVPILMYHRVTKSIAQRSKWAVWHADFVEQMALLKELNVSVLTLDEFLEDHRARREPRNRSVVLTFDDGYAATCANVEDTCGRHGFRATLYLTTTTVGRCDPMKSSGEGILTWDDVRALRYLNVNGHTVTHPRLSCLDIRRVREEIRASKAILEDKLNRAVAHFAYPFGGYTRMVLDEVRLAGYRSACTTHRGCATLDQNPFRLHRVNIDGRDSLDVFRRKIETGFGSHREQITAGLYAPVIRMLNVHDCVEKLLANKSAPS